MPEWDPFMPWDAIRSYLKKRKADQSLAAFDWDYYRAVKLDFRAQLPNTPPAGVFETNVAWFEVFLEREVGPLFDFEAAIQNLPETNKAELVRFFRGKPFVPGISSVQIFDRVHEFFEIIDHHPVAASELIGVGATRARSELLSRAVLVQLTSNGMSKFFENLGYLAPIGAKQGMVAFLNQPALAAAKVLAFNAGLFSGVPVIYLPKLKGVTLSPEEINELMWTGNAEALIESKVGQKLPDKITDRLAKRRILRNLRKRIVQLGVVLSYFWVMQETVWTVEAKELQKAREAIRIEQGKEEARALMRMLDEQESRLDSLLLLF